jgi:general secretion pathway protein K
MNHKNEKGVAILLAVFGLAVMIFLAVDVAYDTQVEYLTATQSVNRLKAYYAAKAGVEISLLRISIYKQALAAAAPQLGEKAQTLLNPIWQFPLSWPILIPDKVNSVDRDEIQSAAKESLMDSQYFVTIEGEGGKIDINDLDSPDPESSARLKEQLVEIFEQEKTNNEEFRDKYSNVDFGELIDAIKDWIDADTDPTGRGSGGESGAYSDRKDGGILPPNQAIKTLDELHMIAGMKDDFYKILSQRVTVFGTKGINVNTAPDLVIKSLSADINDEKMAKINERRNNPDKGGPFKDETDFYGFLRSVGVNTQKLEDSGVLLLYDAELNFRITSAGKFSNTRKEIVAITFDVDNISPALSKTIAEQAKKNQPPPPGGPPPPAAPGASPPPAKSYKSPKGRPRVVYWQEN